MVPFPGDRIHLFETEPTQQQLQSRSIVFMGNLLGNLLSNRNSQIALIELEFVYTEFCHLIER